MNPEVFFHSREKSDLRHSTGIHVSEAESIYYVGFDPSDPIYGIKRLVKIYIYVYGPIKLLKEIKIYYTL